jgi:protocatechuate 3,4-dioxygenase beta subunit
MLRSLGAATILVAFAILPACAAGPRPAGADLPEHVQVHVIEVGRWTYHIDDVLFDDDPRLTPAKRASLITGRGGSGLVTPTLDAACVQFVVRDIRLGRDIPAYPGGGSR